MQKIQFKCDNCEVTGTVKLPDDCDDYRIQCCPCCGEPLPLDDDDEE